MDANETSSFSALSDTDKQRVAELVVEYFELSRDGHSPDLDQYLALLPDVSQQEMFLAATTASLLIGISAGELTVGELDAVN